MTTLFTIFCLRKRVFDTGQREPKTDNIPRETIKIRAGIVSEGVDDDDNVVDDDDTRHTGTDLIDTPNPFSGWTADDEDEANVANAEVLDVSDAHRRAGVTTPFPSPKWDMEE